MSDPIQTPAKEDVWWSNLEDDEVDHNTAGNPPYDLDKVVSRIQRAHRLAPKMVLDMGCGVGRLTNAIAKKLQGNDGTVHGFDIARPLIDIAVAASPGNALYWHSDGRSIPSALYGPFDLIYSVTMFQHIPHDAKWEYIMQAAERLHPDGVFVFTVAVGDEPPTFLNHQLSEAELDDLALAMTSLFSTVSIDGPDENGWTWVEAHA